MADVWVSGIVASEALSLRFELWQWMVLTYDWDRNLPPGLSRLLRDSFSSWLGSPARLIIQAICFVGYWLERLERIVIYSDFTS